MEEEDNISFRDILAPSVEKRVKAKGYINDYAYYFIIAIISLMGMFVPPLLFGCVNGDAAMNFPKTTEAWIVWGVINGGVTCANVSILVLFKNQAKKNVRKNENYLEACRILNKLAGRKEVFVPRSPTAMNAKDYLHKGTMIVVGTFASFAAIAPLIINFDVVTFLSTVISVTISLCTSWACMIRNEEYWTEEYLLYAINCREKAEKGQHDNRPKAVPEHPGAGLEEHGEHPLARVRPEDHRDGDGVTGKSN